MIGLLFLKVAIDIFDLQNLLFGSGKKCLLKSCHLLMEKHSKLFN